LARLLRGARFFSVCVFIFSAAPCFSESRIPTSDDEVLEKIPTALLRQERAGRMAFNPLEKEKLLPSSLTTIRSEIEEGRKTGDPRYYGHASALLEPWLSQKAPSPEILLLHATVLQYNHDFTGALAVLNNVLTQLPHSAQGWIMRASIETTTGKLTAAQTSCKHLYQLAGERITAACLTASAADQDSLENARNLLLHVLIEAPTKEDGAEGSWEEGILAESSERLGFPEEAEKDYHKALEITPDDPYLLAAFSDFLLTRNRFTEVISLLENRTQLDSLLLRLTIAEKNTEKAEFALHRDDLKERFSLQQKRGDSVHLREQAIFALRIEENFSKAPSHFSIFLQLPEVKVKAETKCDQIRSKYARFLL